MQEEMDSLHKNHTYELVKLPKDKKALKNKWVYRIKQEEHMLHPRYKARLVVKGFSQKKCVDFDEIFFSGGENNISQSVSWLGSQAKLGG